MPRLTVVLGISHLPWVRCSPPPSSPTLVSLIASTLTHQDARDPPDAYGGDQELNYHPQASRE